MFKSTRTARILLQRLTIGPCHQGSRVRYRSWSHQALGAHRPGSPLEPSLGGGRPAVGSHRDRDGQEGRRDERSFAQNSSILTKPSAPPSSRTSLVRIQASHSYHLDGVTTMSGLPLSLRETSTEPKVCDHNAKEGLRQGSALPSYVRLRRFSPSGWTFRPLVDGDHGVTTTLDEFTGSVTL